MKEEEFIEKLREYNFLDESITIKVYWSLDDDKNVYLDTDSIEEEFNNKMKELNDILN